MTSIAILSDSHDNIWNLDKALAAPARPGREVADEGRRKEIRERLAKL